MTATENRPLKIAINAQRSPSNLGAGGVESVLIGLVSALGRLEDGPEEYTLIGYWKDPEWLQPYLGANQRIVVGPRVGSAKTFSHLPSWMRPAARRARKWAYDFIAPPANQDPVPLSDGFYENLGCDLIHFPYQKFTLCALPMVYNPHDLQHLHFPQFFTPESIRYREGLYAAGCHYAQTVVTGSAWIKQDIIRHYRLDPEKIQVIPWGPPTSAVEEPGVEARKQVKDRYNLPDTFAFYPAMLWEHKNHARLLEALAHLRERDGIVVHLVCTGDFQTPLWTKIQTMLQALQLESQVHFLGTIPFQDLRAVYQLCQFLLVPTLFEAASGPIFEAWQEKKPVACSRVTSLPEQVGDAALLFHPYAVEDIAAAVRRMATDPQLRAELSARGVKRLADFQWERTAKAYRAVYRRVAHQPLSDEDQKLLKWDWMRNPQANQEDKQT